MVRCLPQSYNAGGRSIPDHRSRYADQIRNLFAGVRPRGATPIGGKLGELLGEYLAIVEPLQGKPAELKKIRPVNFLVITDGYPSASWSSHPSMARFVHFYNSR